MPCPTLGYILDTVFPYTQIIIKKLGLLALPLLSCDTRNVNEHEKQHFSFFPPPHSPWLLIIGCTNSHLTARLATKTANYSAETEKDPPFHHSLRIRTHVHGGAAPSGAPRFHLSGSLKGTHVRVENLEGHLQTSHSRKHKAD